MKILLFSNAPLDPKSGSGRTRLAWSAGLRELGHDVDMVESDELLGTARDKARGRRVRLGWNGWRWLETHDLTQYDLIEFYGSEFWPGTWRLAARRGPRPLLVAHTDGLELLATERLAAVENQSTSAVSRRRPAWRAAASALMQRAERLAFSHSDGFVTGCELDRRYLLDHRIGNPARMEVVPLGLEPVYLDLPPRAERENRVAFLGSWIDRKGVPALVAAMTPVLRARPTLTLDLFGVDTRSGDDPRRDFPADLHGQITVPPRLPDGELIEQLSRAKVYFFPSEYEGFGLALAEAMACGCAAVTTPTGFGAELRDGEEAFLCAFGDAPAMTAAINRLLDDDTLRSRMAAAGRERVQGLRWEHSVRKLEETYLHWLAERHAAPAASMALAAR